MVHQYYIANTKMSIVLANNEECNNDIYSSVYIVPYAELVFWRVYMYSMQL